MSYLEHSFEFEITKNTEKQNMFTDFTDTFISEMVAVFINKLKYVSSMQVKIKLCRFLYAIKEKHIYV